jgi:hypothetical protein
MEQRRWLNFERGLFLATLLLCGWAAYEYVFEIPSPEEPPPPRLAVELPAGQAPSLASAPPLDRLLAAGRDFGVPAALLRPEERFHKPKTETVEADPDPDPGQPPEPQAPAEVAHDVPPPPSEKTRPRVTRSADPTNEAYRLPLVVKGWTQPGPGESLRVIVEPAGGGEAFTLAQGEEYKGVRVRRLTPESVEFENQLGRIILVDRHMLMQQRRAADEGGQEAEGGLTDAFSGAAAGGGPGGELAGLLAGGRLEELRRRWSAMSPQEREALRRRAETLLQREGGGEEWLEEALKEIDR